MGRWSWLSLGDRPAVFPIFACVGGVIAAPWCAISSWVWWAFFVVLVGACLVLTRGAVLAGLGAAFMLGGGVAALSADVTVPAIGERVVLEGVVERVTPHGVVLEVSAVDGVPSRLRAGLSQVDATAPRWTEGARIAVETKLRPVSDATNPGEASRAEWAWRRGEVVTGHFIGARVVVLEAASAWRQWLAREQTSLAEDTHRLTDREDAAALLLTLSAGQRASLDDDVEEAFAKSGLAHVLSVSGLHVAVLAFSLFGVLRWVLSRRQTRGLRLVDPRAFAAPLAVPLVWAYVLFTGWQGPAVRSAVMCSLVLGAYAVRRRSDALNALAIAALVMVVIDPAAPFELSVQLSFCAVLALIFLAPMVRAVVPIEAPSPAVFSGWSLRWRRWREAALQTFAASVAVTVTSAPLVLLAFQRVSLAGLVSNVVTLPVSGVLTLFAAGGAAVHVVSPFVATPVLWVGLWIARLFVGVAAVFAELPFATASMPAAVWPVMIMWWAGLVAIVFFRGRWRWVALVSPLALVLHLVGTPDDGRVRVTFLAVGQGDSIVVSSRGRHALIDGGGVPEGADTGKRFVLPFLRRARIESLELAVLTHAHPDHALGLISTLEEVPTARLWIPAGAGSGPLVRELVAASGDADFEEKEAGESGLALGDAFIEVLGPPVDQSSLAGENDRSVVLLVRHGAVTFLLTGDIEEAGEAALQVGEVTVVKAPHHGSDTSSSAELVARTRPRHVVFCVGVRNRFRFPREEVVDRWMGAGARCHRTDLEGAITFVSDGVGVEVESFGVRTAWPLTPALSPLRREREAIGR
ncbi:MAG: DNA internalization-related competence protein ComEC/Rec2 [Myxococcaceae bacterium]